MGAGTVIYLAVLSTLESYEITVFFAMVCHYIPIFQGILTLWFEAREGAINKRITYSAK